MKIKSDSNLFLFLSFFIFIGALVGFKFLTDPPKIANVFTDTKPGVLNFITPEKIFVGQPFKVKVELDTAKQDTNAVGFYLKFDPTQVQILNVDTTESFCQFYPEKKHDNNLGRLSLACGSPHPGVSGKNTLLTLELIASAVGRINILLDSQSKILLSDGKGTNILTEPQNLSFVVQTSL